MMRRSSPGPTFRRLPFRPFFAATLAYAWLAARALADDAQPAAPPPADAQPWQWEADVVVGLLLLAFLIAMVLLRNALSRSHWSLADALSEECEVSLFDAAGKPMFDMDGKPIVGSEMRASASRFVAIFGLIAILLIFFGFGAVLVKRLAAGEALPSKDEFDRVETYLFSAMTLFAPYFINKFSSVFDWLKPPGRN